MQSDANPSPRSSWWKDILNGFLAWLLAFVLYMLPSLVIAISMGFDLGPKLNDNAEVSRRISQTISEVYHSGWYLHLAFIIVLAILVYWRASSKAKHLAGKSIIHGARIGAAAGVMVILQMISYGVGIYMVIGVVLCVAAGLAGGRQRNRPPISE